MRYFRLRVPYYVIFNFPFYRYPGLTIKYVRGKDPIIKLLDEDDDVVEELAIDKWNTDSVEDFLNTYIEFEEQEEIENVP